MGIVTILHCWATQHHANGILAELPLDPDAQAPALQEFAALLAMRVGYHGDSAALLDALTTSRDPSVPPVIYRRESRADEGEPPRIMLELEGFSDKNVLLLQAKKKAEQRRRERERRTLAAREGVQDSPGQSPTTERNGTERNDTVRNERSEKRKHKRSETYVEGRGGVGEAAPAVADAPAAPAASTPTTDRLTLGISDAPEQATGLVFLTTANSEWPLPPRQLRAWQAKYTMLDVERFLAHVVQRFREQPEKRYSARGMVRGLSAWLDNEADRAVKRGSDFASDARQVTASAPSSSAPTQAPPRPSPFLEALARGEAKNAAMQKAINDSYGMTFGGPNGELVPLRTPTEPRVLEPPPVRPIYRGPQR